MKKIFCLLYLCSFCALCAEYTLTRSGSPCSVVVLESRPTKSAQMGALELVYHVKQITGAELPVVQKPVPGQVNIFIGGRVYSGASEKSEIRFENGNIYLQGKDSPTYGKVDYSRYRTFPPFEYQYNGSLFAVYDFLERACGVRFYGIKDAETAFAPRKTLTVKAENYAHASPMDAFREVNPDGFHAGLMDVTEHELALWRLRWRMTTFFGKTNHNMESIFFYYYKRAKTKYLAPVFRESRPEYFARGYEGQGKGLGDWLLKMNYPGDRDVPPQLCYTAEGVSDFYAKEVLEYAAGRNVKGGWGNKGGSYPTDRTTLPKFAGKPFFYPIEGADNGHFCQCPGCRKLVSDSQNCSRLKFTCLSEIARKAALKDPGAGVSTLAYIHSLAYPDGVKMPENLSVQICLTLYSWWHPESRRLQEAEYAKWLRNEGKRRPLTLWTYLFSSTWDARIHFGKYHPLPVFYPWKTAELMKRFAADGIRGWFTEVELNYNMLEAYLGARICYDPEVDPKQLIDEYFERQYGAAGAAMKTVYREIEAAFWNPANTPAEWLKHPGEVWGPYGKKHPFWGTGLISPDICWGKIGTPERMARWQKLLNQAEKLVRTDYEKRNLRQFIRRNWESALRGRAEYDQFRSGGTRSDAGGKVARAGNLEDWSRCPVNKMQDARSKDSRGDFFQMAEDGRRMYFRYVLKDSAFQNGSLAVYFSDLEGRNRKQLQIRIQNMSVEAAAAGKGLQIANLKLTGDSGERVIRFDFALQDVPWGRFGMKGNVVRLPGGQTEDSAGLLVWSPVWFATDYGEARYHRPLCPSTIVIGPEEFSYEHLARKIEDPASASGLAGRMDAKEGWTLKYFAPRSLVGKHEVTLYMRCDTLAENRSFTVGLYDKFNRKMVMGKTVHTRDLQGKQYRPVSLGKVMIAPGNYFYLTTLRPAPAGKGQFHYYVEKIVIQ